jgi:hypothetical protein
MILILKNTNRCPPKNRAAATKATPNTGWCFCNGRSVPFTVNRVLRDGAGMFFFQTRSLPGRSATFLQTIETSNFSILRSELGSLILVTHSRFSPRFHQKRLPSRNFLS